MKDSYYNAFPWLMWRTCTDIRKEMSKIQNSPLYINKPEVQTSHVIMWFFAENKWIHLISVFMYFVDETGIDVTCLRHFRSNSKINLRITELTNQLEQCKNLHATYFWHNIWNTTSYPAGPQILQPIADAYIILVLSRPWAKTWLMTSIFPSN